MICCRTSAVFPGFTSRIFILCDAKKKMWLVAALVDRRIDLKRLPDIIGSARQSFGSADRLLRTFGVELGSVTPFAVINDPGAEIQVVLDARMMTQPTLNSHPLINTQTTSIASGNPLLFISACGPSTAGRGFGPRRARLIVSTSRRIMLAYDWNNEVGGAL